jgi:hypothetical protein
MVNTQLRMPLLSDERSTPPGMHAVDHESHLVGRGFGQDAVPEEADRAVAAGSGVTGQSPIPARTA